MIVAKFSTLADGVFIEETLIDQEGATRCFRFNRAGRAEYALYGDLTANPSAARWFGHQYTEKDFILC